MIVILFVGPPRAIGRCRALLAPLPGSGRLEDLGQPVFGHPTSGLGRQTRALARGASGALTRPTPHSPRRSGREVQQAVGRWGEVFGDAVAAAAMIDRLVHHAEVVSLKGDSYRPEDRDLGTVPTDDSP